MFTYTHNYRTFQNNLTESEHYVTEKPKAGGYDNL